MSHWGKIIHYDLIVLPMSVLDFQLKVWTG